MDKTPYGAREFTQQSFITPFFAVHGELNAILTQEFRAARSPVTKVIHSGVQTRGER
jgi:hypothetical protein